MPSIEVLQDKYTTVKIMDRSATVNVKLRRGLRVPRNIFRFNWLDRNTYRLAVSPIADGDDDSDDRWTIVKVMMMR